MVDLKKLKAELAAMPKKPYYNEDGIRTNPVQLLPHAYWPTPQIHDIPGNDHWADRFDHPRD